MLLNKVPDVRLDKHKGKLGKGWRQAASQHCQRNRCVTVLCLLIAAAAGVLVVNSGGMARLMDAPIKEAGRVLLVTAHPDDEVIFFSSTVTALHSSGSEIFLLCLTNGGCPKSLPISHHKHSGEPAA